MTGLKTVVGAAAMLAVATAALPAVADSDERGDKTPQELAIEGMDRLMRALEMMIQSIPQYDAPYIDENGDIIIRRRNPAPEPEPELGPTPTPPGGIST